MPAPIQPMLAKPVDELPTGEGWLFEAKYDGFRAVCAVDRDGGVAIWSRKGTPLGLLFPEIRDALYEALPRDAMVDGEIVRWGPGERLDFPALVRRMSAGAVRAAQLAEAEPCHLVLFDVLRVEGREVMALPLAERRLLLEQLLAGLRGAHPVTVSLLTSDRHAAELWLGVLSSHGVEGLVIFSERRSCSCCDVTR